MHINVSFGGSCIYNDVALELSVKTATGITHLFLTNGFCHPYNRYDFFVQKKKEVENWNST